MLQPTVDRMEGTVKRTVKSVNVPRWLSFPALERIVTSRDVVAIERIETMYSSLDLISKTGTPAERTRAREAQSACMRTLDLLHVVLGPRQKTIEALSKYQLKEKQNVADTRER